MKVTVLVSALVLASSLSFAQQGQGNSSIKNCPLNVFIEEDGRLPREAITQIENRFQELGYKVTDRQEKSYFTYSLPQSGVSSGEIRVNASFERNHNSEILFMGVYAEGRFMNLFAPSQSPKAWKKKIAALMRRIGVCGSETTLIDGSGEVIKTIKFY